VSVRASRLRKIRSKVSRVVRLLVKSTVIKLKIDQSLETLSTIRQSETPIPKIVVTKSLHKYLVPDRSYTLNGLANLV